MAKTMAEEITAAERTAEQTLLEAEKKALLIVSDAKEKAKADRKSILENAENVADGLLSDARQKAVQLRASAGNEAESALDTLKQSYDKNITAAVNRAAEILKS